MSDQTITVALEERTTLGKGLQQLRREGAVPAVIHNHGKESIHVVGNFTELSKVYSQAGKHHPVEVKVGGKNHLALIKDVDVEPTKHRLRHIVFQAINRNETTTAEIPVVLSEGNIPAERAGLLVLTQLDVVEVEALPRDLPNQLLVDASPLTEAGDKLTLADIQVPKGVTVLGDPEQIIATVEMPKDQIAEADAAAEGLAADAGQPSTSPEPEVEAPQANPEESK